jgi:hypothetical protein
MTMANLSETLRDKWDGISTRERRLVLLLLVAVPTILLIFLGTRISEGLTAIEGRNRDLRRALIAVEDLRARGHAASAPSAKDPTADIPAEPMDLESYLNGAAEKLGLTIPSFNRQQPVKKNGFVASSIRIDLRGLTITQVAELLGAIEGNSKAVAITSLSLTQNFANKEQLDLKLDVAAYSREPQVDPAAGSGEGSG